MENNIILSTYFTSKIDYQRCKHQSNDDYQYIKDWYESIISLQLKGIIFHDNLSDNFVRKYQNKNIKFIKVKVGNLSLNDERFFIYLNFLKENIFDYVLMTDISDVVFNKNPFLIINDKYDLYIGSEPWNFQHKDWILERYRIIYGKEPLEYYDNIVLNAGIIGGKYLNIMELLKKYTSEMKSLSSKRGKQIDKINKKRKIEKISFNMIVLNKVIYANYNMDKVYTAKLLHNPFKSYFRDRKYFIFHK